ncbi:MAG: PAS domain S-box protein [Actinobacteria bacterium]|nr:PAS domain S-box protein [Actinomycetota bacterium]
MLQPQSNRLTLVEALEKLDVHDHLCLIYESREEQLAAVIPFMKIGLERGERCVYIADDNTVAAVMTAMRERGIDVDAAVDAGALSIITKREAYLKEGRFDPDWMIGFLKDAVAAAKADGFSALRATGEMTWVLGGEPGTERLIEYESRLNYFFPDNDCLAICQYDRNRFDPEIIANVIRTHPLVIYGTNICRNFYYIPPDEFLEADRQKGNVETERLLASLLDRERAEAALRDSELAYHTLAESLPGMVYRVFVRENNRMQFFNRAAKEITGYTAEELKEGDVCSIDPIIVEEDQKLVTVEVRYAVAENRPFSIEYRIRHRDGNIRNLIEQGSPVFGADGKPLYIDGIIFDVTERVKAEQALRQSEERLRLMTENAMDVIYRYRIMPEPGFEFVSPSATRITGYTPEEHYADPDLSRKIVHPDDLHLIDEIFSSPEKITAPLTIRWIRKDGRTIWTEQQNVPVFDPDGVLVAIDGIVRDITSRKHAEEAYWTLVDNSLQGLAIFQGMQLVFANRALAAITGYTVEELLAMSPIQLEKNIYPEDRKKVMRHMTDIYEGRDVEPDIKIRFVKNDGSIIWTDSMISLTEYQDKPALQAVYIDITRRKKSEEELVEAHRLLETIFDHTHMMVALLDAQLNFIRVNRAYAQADGKEPAFYTGKNHFDLFPNEENETIFRKVVETGEPFFTSEKPFQYEEHPERGVSYWDWSLVPIMDEAGTVTSLIFTLLDVTERVLSQEAIFRSEQKYHRLFEESKDGIIIVTSAGKIEDINPAGVEMLGYSSREELLALDSDRELFADRGDHNIYLQTLKQQGFVKNYELDLKRKDGTPLVVSITASVVRDNDGKVTSFRGIIRDLTAHRQLEQQLMQAQKMESIGRLAGGIAHDFNNFLTAIHGYIDLAAMDLPDGSPARENLVEAKASSDRAANLSRQLLLFSRRESLNLKPVDLKRVVYDLLKMLDRLIGEQYEIRTDLAADLRTISADTSHLEQVLMNLTVNARDAMPGGGIITIKARNVVVQPGFVKARPDMSPREFVQLSVTDSGVGMNAEVKSRIFEPFFSTKGIGKGTGLGLSVVYGIISQHGGWIDVDSTPGAGTEFDIYFPALDVTPIKEQPEEILIGEIAGSGERILLVEDDDDIRKMVVKSLADHGYLVFEAADAESAMDLYEREEGRFDLVFSDVVLPGHDGVWLVDQLKAQKPELEVLLASGYSEAMDQKLIVERGYRLMRKPYSLAEILTVIHGMVKK